MKRQLQGIALILFGILLALFSVVLAPNVQGDYDVLPCVLGGIFGVVGLFFVFLRTKN